MFKVLLTKFKNWWSRISEPVTEMNSYKEDVTLISSLSPEKYRKIYSSNFNTVKVCSYKKTLDEYNFMVNTTINYLKVDKKPVEDFSKTYSIPIPSFFLTKEGNFCHEEDLLNKFKENSNTVIQWLIDYESNADYEDSNYKYLFMKRIHESNIELTTFFLNITA